MKETQDLFQDFSFSFFSVHTANGSLLLFLSKNIHFTPIIISVNQTNFAAKDVCDEKKKMIHTSATRANAMPRESTI